MTFLATLQVALASILSQVANIEAVIKVIDKIGAATSTTDGFMSSTDKTNLNTLTSTNTANKGKVWKTDNSGKPAWGTDSDTIYTHPSISETPSTYGYEHIPDGGSNGQYLMWLSKGKAKWDNGSRLTVITPETHGDSYSYTTVRGCIVLYQLCGGRGGAGGGHSTLGSLATVVRNYDFLNKNESFTVTFGKNGRNGTTVHNGTMPIMLKATMYYESNANTIINISIDPMNTVYLSVLFTVLRNSTSVYLLNSSGTNSDSYAPLSSGMFTLNSDFITFKVNKILIYAPYDPTELRFVSTSNIVFDNLDSTKQFLYHTLDIPYGSSGGGGGGGTTASLSLNNGSFQSLGTAGTSGSSFSTATGGNGGGVGQNGSPGNSVNGYSSVSAGGIAGGGGYAAGQYVVLLE
jgi:hypothetical protein